MTATVSDAGPYEKLLTFTVTDAEIDAAKSKAARRLSKEVKIRGFRPGKAPRPVVEAAVGAERLRSEAIDEAIPTKLDEVLKEHEIAPAVTPELANMEEADGGLEVEVKVTLWPRLVSVPDHRDRTVELDSVEVADEEIDAQLDRIRDQFARLETVERAARTGDFVSIDIAATSEGQEVPEATAEQLLYEIGSGGFVDGIDEALVGLSAGEEIVHSSELPSGFGDRAGQPVDFAVKVTEVREKILPDLDDEWVSEVTEFETLDDLRADLAERIGEMKRRSLRSRFEDRALEQLVDEVDIELPDGLVRAEMDEIMHRFAHRLEEQEVSFEDYLQVSGIDQETFVDDVRLQADRSLRTRLLLEGVAREAGVDVSPEEVAALIEGLSARTENPQQTRRNLQARALSLAGDILRNKALEAVISAARAVDGDGNEIDLTPEDDVVAEEVVPVADDVSAEEAGTGELVTGEVLTGELVTDELEIGEIVEAEVIEEGIEESTHSVSGSGADEEE